MCCLYFHNAFYLANNNPTIKRVAKRQQTKQKSKCQLVAQGYNNARTITYYQATYSGSRGKTRSRRNRKQAFYLGIFLFVSGHAGSSNLTKAEPLTGG
jgi:hypothetical protein